MAGDAEAAGETAEKLSAHASSAASLTNDPVWRSFELVPVLGSNFTAVRELAAIVDGVSQSAITPLVGVARSVELGDFKPVDGSIDLQPLIQARSQVAAASTALAVSEKSVRAIQTGNTLDVVRRAADQLEAAVTRAAGSVDVVDRAVRLAPNMLGAAGPRNYVLMFQNPAELRATGGIAGAVALLHAENGRITLAQQASSGDFPRYDTPVLPLADETRGLYGDITGQYIQDVNLTPDFPQSALLAREMWRTQFGLETDGVISIDPVSLSYLLRATGPITLATGEVLTAENAVQLLLSDVYSRYEDPADQDAFFAAAAASVFSTVSRGDADPVALVTALAQAGSEHRVLVWNANDEDQAVLTNTTLAGGLPLSNASATRFGVYLNDATGAKMGMYLDMQVAVGQVTCRKDKRPNYGVSVTLSNTAPADAAITLSDYVTGGGVYGVAPGNVKTVVSAYGAPGMQNLGMTRDDSVVAYHPATDSSHPVSAIEVELAPGESTVLHFGWLGLEPSSAPIVAQSTPVIHLNETRELELGCESALW
ncbi:DUF4012 domain-containing protein [Cryobacterium cheniae]|uniref:DUF4012 domain-containing protein n=1 Tax=Cryobacterium cheniae TaxID=1259262 RepID=UPI00141BBC2E|nr:DUF4012 domain-containing protein [Cryobacterium cheniae]